jgi:hydrogenase/urease accessory protein HupE
MRLHGLDGWLAGLDHRLAGLDHRLAEQGTGWPSKAADQPVRSAR